MQCPYCTIETETIVSFRGGVEYIKCLNCHQEWCAERQKPEPEPMFYIEWRRNHFGHLGPLLVDHDGVVVPDQTKVVVEHEIEGINTVTVSFNVHDESRFVRVREVVKDG